LKTLTTSGDYPLTSDLTTLLMGESAVCGLQGSREGARNEPSIIMIPDSQKHYPK
jgi:hypothetical protein